MKEREDRHEERNEIKECRMKETRTRHNIENAINENR
jgi:hypothetical protein